MKFLEWIYEFLKGHGRVIPGTVYGKWNPIPIGMYA